MLKHQKLVVAILLAFCIQFGMAHVNWNAPTQVNTNGNQTEIRITHNGVLTTGANANAVRFVWNNSLRSYINTSPPGTPLALPLGSETSCYSPSLVRASDNTYHINDIGQTAGNGYIKMQYRAQYTTPNWYPEIAYSVWGRSSSRPTFAVTPERIHIVASIKTQDVPYEVWILQDVWRLRSTPNNWIVGEPLNSALFGNPNQGADIVNNNNNLYLTYTTADAKDIFYQYSTDDGMTWSQQTSIYHITSGDVVNPCIAANGSNVCIAWLEQTDVYLENIVFKQSTDGGINWNLHWIVYSGSDITWGQGYLGLAISPRPTGLRNIYIAFSTNIGLRVVYWDAPNAIWVISDPIITTDIHIDRALSAYYASGYDYIDVAWNRQLNPSGKQLWRQRGSFQY